MVKSTKRYKIKPTKKQLAKIKLYWAMAQAENALYWTKIGDIERKMSKVVGIRDMEIFHCDGEMAGVGNYDRTMELLQRKKLELPDKVCSATKQTEPRLK